MTEQQFTPYFNKLVRFACKGKTMEGTVFYVMLHLEKLKKNEYIFIPKEYLLLCEELYRISQKEVMKKFYKVIKITDIENPEELENSAKLNHYVSEKAAALTGKKEGDIALSYPSREIQEKTHDILTKVEFPTELFSITNTTNKPQVVNLFNKANKKTNFGFPKGIVVEGYCGLDFLKFLKKTSIDIGLIRLFCDNNKQIDEEIKIKTYHKELDYEHVKVINPKDYTFFYTPSDISSTEQIPINSITDIAHDVKLTAETQIQLTVLPNTTIDVRLYEKPTSASYSDNLGKTPIPPIGVRIENTTNQTKKAVLFGSSKNFHAANFGSDNGIKITSKFSDESYPFVLSESAIRPIKAKVIRLRSSNRKQVREPLCVKQWSPGGSSSANWIYTESYLSSKQHHETIVDMKKELEINSQVQLEIDILPNTSLTVTFFLT